MKETTNIFGYNFICAENYDTLADRVISDVRTGEAGLTNFITPNAHGINMYARLPEVNVFCQQSRYVLPDGQPIVWLSRFTDRIIKQRLTGSDFFPVMFRKIKGAEHRCLFIMSNDELGKMILTEKPDARYLVPPFFGISETDSLGDFVLNAAEIIQKFNLNYVFIGISEPKQGLLNNRKVAKIKLQEFLRIFLFRRFLRVLLRIEETGTCFFSEDRDGMGVQIGI